MIAISARPRPSRAILATAFLVLTLVASGAAAQEVQSSFDAGGTIQVVNQERAAQLGLFLTEYPGFVEARLFEANGTTTLEVMTRRDGGLVRTRVPLTATQLADLRARVAQALERPAAIPTQNARSLLLTASTLMGIGLYGWTLPVALDVQDDKSATALYMMTASASFFVPWLMTGSSVTPAMAQAAYYGGTRGYLHGGMLHYMIAGQEEPRTVCDLDVCYTEDDDVGRGALAAGFVTGIAEGVGGYLWAKGSGMTGGEANAISLGGDWGLANGLGLAHLIGMDDPLEEQAGAAFGLAGAAVGLVGGHVIARNRDYSYGDVEVLGTAGLLAAYSSGIVLDRFGVDSRPLTASVMAGTAAGLYLADRLVEGADLSYGQSAMVRLGTIAGGLLGGGTGLIIESEDGDLTPITSVAGAIAGFVTTYRLVAPATRGGGQASAISIDIAPQGIATLVGGSRLGAGVVPLATVGFRF